ncbi:hypothetical protein G6F37_005522 [Rhizopus arrhizus]|nr:hypothetical protein G6F38_005629 [Rhizopus arrhizus]KAG1158734.1 hypothetical protein G6F37_005522 [Rhizopus arrhizus]
MTISDAWTMLTISPSRTLSRPLIVWIDIELNNDSPTSSQSISTTILNETGPLMPTTKHGQTLLITCGFREKRRSSLDNPWMFKNTNVTQLFGFYQAIIRGMIHKHQTLPIESYIHELAAHTHTFVLCKNQQSSIAERVFSKSLLTDLTTDLVSEVVDLDLPFPQEELFTLTTTLFNLALGTTTREQTMLDLYIMSSKMAYGPKRIVRSVVNLLQKLPATPLKSHDTITETELWSTYSGIHEQH